MKPLIMLHGAIGAMKQLEPLAGYLSDSSIHLINFSGHGGKPLPEKFSIDRFSDDVLNYMGENAIDSADFFGYSMGGYVALNLSKDHPKRIGKIFTLATKFDWRPDVAARESKMLDAEKIAERFPDFALALEMRHSPQNWREVLRKTSAMMLELGLNPPFHREEDFKNIVSPVCIAVGSKDKMVSEDESKNAAALIPNAMFKIFEDVPHPIEQADAAFLAKEISAFFRG